MISVAVSFSLACVVFGRFSSYDTGSNQPVITPATRQGDATIQYNYWQLLTHYDANPVTALSSGVQQVFAGLKQRQTKISDLAYEEEKRATQSQGQTPLIGKVFWVVENFVAGENGSILAKTRQAAGGAQQLNYAQPLFRVKLDPSDALHGYVNAKGGVKLHQSYSVIEIDIDCVNQAKVNNEAIAVYTHGGPTNFHLTFDPNSLSTIWQASDPKLNELYDAKFPLRIPQNCYQQTIIPSDELDAAEKQYQSSQNVGLTLTVIDISLNKHGLLSKRGGPGHANPNANVNPGDSDDNDSDDSDDQPGAGYKKKGSGKRHRLFTAN